MINFCVYSIFLSILQVAAQTAKNSSGRTPSPDNFDWLSFLDFQDLPPSSSRLVTLDIPSSSFNEEQDIHKSPGKPIKRKREPKTKEEQKEANRINAKIYRETQKATNRAEYAERERPRNQRRKAAQKLLSPEKKAFLQARKKTINVIPKILNKRLDIGSL